MTLTGKAFQQFVHSFPAHVVKHTESVKHNFFQCSDDSYYIILHNGLSATKNVTLIAKRNW